MKLKWQITSAGYTPGSTAARVKVQRGGNQLQSNPHRPRAEILRDLMIQHWTRILQNVGPRRADLPKPIKLPFAFCTLHLSPNQGKRQLLLKSKGLRSPDHLPQSLSSHMSYKIGFCYFVLLVVPNVTSKGIFVSSVDPKISPHSSEDPGLSSPCVAYRKLIYTFLLPSTA